MKNNDAIHKIHKDRVTTTQQTQQKYIDSDHTNQVIETEPHIAKSTTCIVLKNIKYIQKFQVLVL